MLNSSVTHETETASAFTRTDNSFDPFESDGLNMFMNPFVTPTSSFSSVSLNDISLGKKEVEFLGDKVKDGQTVQSTDSFDFENGDKVKDESAVNDVFGLGVVLSQKSINIIFKPNFVDSNRNLRPMHSMPLDDYGFMLKEKLEVGKASNQAGLSGKNDNPRRSKQPDIQNKTIQQDVKNKKKSRGRSADSKTGGGKAGATASINLNCQRKKVHLSKGKKKSGTPAAHNGSTTRLLKTSPIADQCENKKVDSKKRRGPGRPKGANQCEKKKVAITSNIGKKRRGPGRPKGATNKRIKVKHAITVKSNAAASLSLTACTPNCQSNDKPVDTASNNDDVKREQPATPKTSKSTEPNNVLKFNKKVFTSHQAQKLFKCSKIPLKDLKKSKPSGSDKRYTKSDVNCFVVKYGKLQKKKRYMNMFSTLEEIKYDNSKTIDENMKCLQGALHGVKKIEVLEETPRWSEALNSTCLQAFVKFRNWPNRYSLIAKYMGNVKTLKQIRDHVGKVRRRVMKTDEKNPYVKYYKKNNKKKKRNTSTSV